MRLPVFQMAYGQRKGKNGLMFSSELEEVTSQSVLFAIPLFDYSRRYYNIRRYLEDQEVFFPFFLDDKYYELIASIDYPTLTFKIPNKEIEIVFEIEDANYFYRSRFPFGKRVRKNQKYVGDEIDLVKGEVEFLTLIPIDLFEMDDLYEKYKGVFVGMTPAIQNIQ